MAINKSDLYISLWKSCDEFRGLLDASQYKDYVLTLLFVKYVSDKAAGDSGSLIKVPEGGSFSDMVAAQNDKEIGDKLNKIVGKLAETNDLRGVIDITDFNDQNKLGKGQDMVDRLSNLIGIFQQPEFDFSTGNLSAGAIYEDLLRYFSNISGKGMGIPYIPFAVNQLMAKSLGIFVSNSGGDVSVYDPNCGSGSLLLQVAEERDHSVTLYGQEINSTAYAQARMNMILHGALKAKIVNGNSLSEPQFIEGDQLKQFDYVVACPPFNLTHWDFGFDPENDRYNRFVHGIPPKVLGNFAHIQHMLASLKPSGRMAVLVSHNILYQGGAVAAIRQSILESDLVEAIIGLPANLLSHTGIPTCLLICSKRKSEERTQKILFINADRDFAKERSKNVLLPEHVEKITQALETYSDVDRFSRVVSLDEIRNNGFNLNIPRYVDTSELTALLNQHCDEFDKYLIRDLALEINSIGAGKGFEEKENALFIPRMKGPAPTADLKALAIEKHRRYFQVVLNDKAINHYVVQFLHSTIGQLALSALATGSMTPRIDRASLGEVIIALPDLAHQKSSVETHRKLTTLRESIEKISQDLSLNPTLSSEFEAQLDSMLEVAGKLSKADQIRSIIRQGESKTVEFKETYDFCVHQKKQDKRIETSALKTIVAFLNSEGGTLLIGVSDEPKIVGIERELEKFYKNNEDKFLTHMKNKMKERIGEQFYPFIDYNLIEVDGSKLVHFRCERSDSPCFLDKTEFYVRTNPASDKIEGQKLYEYMKNHFKDLNTH